MTIYQSHEIREMALLKEKVKAFLWAAICFNYTKPDFFAKWPKGQPIPRKKLTFRQRVREHLGRNVCARLDGRRQKFFIVEG